MMWCTWILIIFFIQLCNFGALQGRWIAEISSLKILADPSWKASISIISIRTGSNVHGKPRSDRKLVNNSGFSVVSFMDNTEGFSLVLTKLKYMTLKVKRYQQAQLAVNKSDGSSSHHPGFICKILHFSSNFHVLFPRLTGEINPTDQENGAAVYLITWCTALRTLYICYV